MRNGRKLASTRGFNRYPYLGVPVRLARVARAEAVPQPVPPKTAGHSDRYPSGTPPVPLLAGNRYPYAYRGGAPRRGSVPIRSVVRSAEFQQKLQRLEIER